MIELLVVIAISAVLIALLLPTVQQDREAGGGRCSRIDVLIDGAISDIRRATLYGVLYHD